MFKIKEDKREEVPIDKGLVMKTKNGKKHIYKGHLWFYFMQHNIKGRVFLDTHTQKAFFSNQ